MLEILHKRTLRLYWFVLLVHLVLQFFISPYRAVTKPMLVPLLLLYLLALDENIGRPIGKSLFYTGLFLAFFGDVLLIIINDTFFLSGMIAFMLMNLFYSASFIYLSRLRFQTILPFFLSSILLFFVGYYVDDFLRSEMGDYRMPILIYMFTLAVMVSFSVNVLTNANYRKIAIRWLIPGTIVFLFENILVALNKFHWSGNKDVYIAIMFTYGLAQYLIVRGIKKVYF